MISAKAAPAAAHHRSGDSRLHQPDERRGSMLPSTGHGLRAISKLSSRASCSLDVSIRRLVAALQSDRSRCKRLRQAAHFVEERQQDGVGDPP